MAVNSSKIKALAKQTYDALSTEFPDSTCSLDNDCPHNLAVRGILSAQCTDKRVNITAKDLFAKYPDMKQIADEDPEVIASIIKPCGLTASKTKSVIAFAKKLTEEWGGVIPNDVDLLMEVPGIGRKIANLIVGEVYGTPAVVVDTHCKRVMKRIGIGHLSVDLGRKYCTAKSPKCDECPLSSFCKRRI